MAAAVLTTGQLISLATGRLACEFSEVHWALDTLLDDKMMTHQLPRAIEYLEPLLVEDFPWLKDVPELVIPDRFSNNARKLMVMDWLKKIEEKHGPVHAVRDYSGQWIKFNPIDELAAMVGESGGEIVVVEIREDEGNGEQET